MERYGCLRERAVDRDGGGHSGAMAAERDHGQFLSAGGTAIDAAPTLPEAM